MNNDAVVNNKVRVVVYANGDCSYLVWSIGSRLDNCLGFAIRRRKNGIEEVLDNYVGFSGKPAEKGVSKPSVLWPIQEFSWFDYKVRPGDNVQYQVIPMIGTPDQLSAQNEKASEWSEPIIIGDDQTQNISAFFNRGVVMSQWVARQLEGKDESPVKILKEKLKHIDDRTRKFLAGELGEKLLRLLDETRLRHGHVYVAMFELNDPALISSLCAFGSNGHMVLANGSAPAGKDENTDARSLLRQHNVEIYDRMLKSPHLGHNKFMIICDEQQKPVAVWTGSANWTTTGLCTQTNNSIFIQDTNIAQIFRDQWDHLVKAGNDETNDLKEANSILKSCKVVNTNISIFFSPTPHQEDMQYASRFIKNAREGILFLQFNPGALDKGTLLDYVIEKAKQSDGLYIRGLVNQDLKNSDKTISLIHGGNYLPSNFQVVLPNGVSDAGAFFANEITANQFMAPGGIGHAIIHSKVMVIDPFGEFPVVMTGSHNMGPKASSDNDENLVIIENNRKLAIEYAVHIKSLYDHYRWRFRRGMGEITWQGLSEKDNWQDGFLQQASRDAFWLKSQQG